LAFTTAHVIPSSGSILVYAKVSATMELLPGCRSMYTLAADESKLVDGTLTSIDCQVITVNGHTAWYIKGFATLAKNSVVKIAGPVNAKVAASNAALIDVITYGTEHTTPYTHARLIDKKEDI
jgi:hypothetical protein